jgi:glycosyltransferase involved in cell wall biosynthesis
MRIGIDCRFVAQGPLIRRRGMARYTLAQISAVIARGGIEPVLICHPGFTPTLSPGIANATDLEIAWTPEGLHPPGDLLNRPSIALRASADWQDWLQGLRLDLYHATMPFVLEELIPERTDVCPLVCTLYDFIPLRYPDHYHPTAEVRAAYERALRHARRCAQGIAISRFVCQEAQELLGLSGSRLTIASPVADPIFRRLPPAEAANTLSRLGLPIEGAEYLLTITHSHFTKNLDGLLRGFALLTPRERATHPLVVVADLPELDRELLAARLEREGLGSSVHLAGGVPDDDLVALYNAAFAYVHPSRHEGFGLPILEALRCGAPVIAHHATAPPEIVGQAGLLLDFEQPAEIAAAIRALSDHDLRRDLVARAEPRAEGYTVEALGRGTQEAYRRALERPAARPDRARIALWSPLPPVASGVADYSRELLGGLADWADVEVFVDGHEPVAREVLESHVVRDGAEFSSASRRRRFDLVFYQLGVNRLHLYASAALERWSGVCVLHDLPWSHLLLHDSHVQRHPETFRLALESIEGKATLAEFDALGRPGDPRYEERREEFLNRHHMLGELIGLSSAQILHWRAGAEEVRRRHPNARVFAFPMGVTDPLAGPPDSDQSRRELGVPAQALLVGAFGAADPVKRLEPAVDALAEAVASGVDAHLLVVGAFTTPDYRRRLAHRIHELGLAARVQLLGRVPIDRFLMALRACDVVVNFRHPFRHQMSATLMRAVAAGKPVLVSAEAAWGDLPESFCQRIAADASEVPVLAATFRRLAREPEWRRTMAADARDWYLEHATIAHMAAGYRRAFDLTLHPSPIEEVPS